MKRFMTAVALSLALSSAALAGDIPSVGITSSAPEGSPSRTWGQIPTVPSDSTLEVSALDIIQTVLSLLSV